MATSISAALRHNPDLINANCYLFALAPGVGAGGYTKRPHKAQPGERCHGGDVPPLAFDDPTRARVQLIQRVLCDNPPPVVKLLDRYPYNPSILTRPRRDEASGKRHLMACIYGPSDFHFLRRMYLHEVLRSTSKLQPMTDAQLDLLRQGLKDGRKYVWVHQRGWMPPGSAPLSAARLRFRRRMGVAEKDLQKFGSPTVFDASGEPCWSCVPRDAPEANPAFGMFSARPPTNNFAYDGLSYNRFCGLFSVLSRRAHVHSDHDVLPRASRAATLKRLNGNGPSFERLRPTQRAIRAAVNKRL